MTWPVRFEKCCFCGEWIWLCDGWKCGGKTVTGPLTARPTLRYR